MDLIWCLELHTSQHEIHYHHIPCFLPPSSLYADSQVRCDEKLYGVHDKWRQCQHCKCGNHAYGWVAELLLPCMKKPLRHLAILNTLCLIADVTKVRMQLQAIRMPDGTKPPGLVSHCDCWSLIYRNIHAHTVCPAAENRSKHSQERRLPCIV